MTISGSGMVETAEKICIDCDRTPCECTKYYPGPVATFFHADRNNRVKLLIGPFGTGKTTSAAWDIVSQSKRVLGGKSRFAVIRNTYPELRDTTIKTYLDWFPDGVFGKYNQTEKRYSIKFQDRNIEILFKALDTPKDVRDLLSLELTGAHVDEAREIHEDVFKGLLGRIGRYPSLKDTGGKTPFLNPPQVILTTNYPSTEHWIYRDFVSSPVSGYSIYQQTQQENKHNLRPGYYEDLERDYASRPDLLRTLVRGEWGVTVKGKQVYPEFRRELHVSPKPMKPDDTLVIRGWDNTGLSPACVVTQLSSTGQWLILKEFCGEDIGIVDFGEMVNLWCANTFGSNAKYRDIGDPAGKNRDSNKMSPADYLRKININVEDGIQTFKVRREAVAGRLTKLINGAPAILIDPACTRLIDGFEGGYAYPEIGTTGIFRDEPAKNEYSHVADSLQYPATRLFINERKESHKYKPPVVHGGEQAWMG
ncbi:MAG: phage terminase large subunit [Patescibacteria group bacterium]|nr:phage terminase large subunit [Patescibacteria group bacterium]